MVPSNKVKAPYDVGLGVGSHKPAVTGEARTKRYDVPRKETPGNPRPRTANAADRDGWANMHTAWANMHTAVHPDRMSAVLANRVGTAPPMVGGHGDGSSAGRPVADRARKQAGKKR